MQSLWVKICVLERTLINGGAASTAFCGILRSSSKFSRGRRIMSVKMAEEVAVQVPADDFQALEQKVYRTIELYKAAREARSIAERDVKRLREQLEEREEELETLRREMVQLRREREEVRGRVEKMLRQVESLTEEQAAS
jgi:chromosome segregation ATPase